jgi:hypothetical protein
MSIDEYMLFLKEKKYLKSFELRTLFGTSSIKKAKRFSNSNLRKLEVRLLLPKNFFVRGDVYDNVSQTL